MSPNDLGKKIDQLSSEMSVLRQAIAEEREYSAYLQKQIHALIGRVSSVENRL